MKKMKEYLDYEMMKKCIYGGVTVIAVCVTLYLLYLTGDFWNKLWSLFLAVLRPMIIGGILCYLITPLVNRLEKLFRGNSTDKRTWARPAAVFFSVLVVILVLVLFVLLIAITMYRGVSSINMDMVMNILSTAQNDLDSFISSLAKRLEDIGLSSDKLTNIVMSSISGISDTTSGLLFGVIFAIYFLLDGTRISSYWKRAVRLLAGDRAIELIDILAVDADRVFSGYIRGQFIDAVIVGVLSSIAFLIAGIPNALVVGVLAGFGNLIPYIGPVLGFLTLVLVCVPTAAWTKLITGAIILIVIMMIDSNLINPRLLSSSVKVHPLLVVAALIGGGALGGLIGMIVAVPVAALLKVQLDRHLDKIEHTS